MLAYLKKDRAWLPSIKKGSKVKRDLVETEIRKWRVDIGLAKPSTLTTKVAREFQEVLNTEPNGMYCSDRRAIEMWRARGPIKLSWIA